MSNPPVSGGGLQRIDMYPDHLRLIGLVVTEFSLLESSMSLAMWALVGSPAHGTALYYSINGTRARADALRAVAVETLGNDKVLDEFKDVLADFDRVAGQRNAVVHGQWGIPADEALRGDPFVQDFRMKAKDRYPRRIYTIGDLQAIADEIAATARRFDLITQVIEAFQDAAAMKRVEQLRQQVPAYDAYWKKFD
jgi:hypothetical protein